MDNITRVERAEWEMFLTEVRGRRLENAKHVLQLLNEVLVSNIPLLVRWYV